jgi:hypothetical protein
MIKNIYLFILIFCLLLNYSCSKKSNISPDKLSEKSINNILSNDSLKTIQNPTSIDSINSNNQFFELEQSMKEIQNELQILKNQVMNYEYNPNGENYTEKLKSLIDKPPHSHRISLINGSIIDGTIEEDQIDFILINTEVGKLTLNKSNILGIEDLILPIPNLVFIGHGKEEIFTSYREFSGKIMNQGNRRADFVRIIYNLWNEKTQLAATDSTFLDGSQFIYSSGIITDTVLEPNESARFSLKISVPDSISISYVTRDIRWEMFD